VYIRLHDAEADGADWMEASLLVLEIDPNLEPKRAGNAWQGHLSRAKWMIENGYQHLLRRGVHGLSVDAVLTSFQVKSH
jgi:hypothetical protein